MIVRGLFPVVAVAIFLLAALSASAGETLTLTDADSRLAIAERLIAGGVYERAEQLAESVLADPAAQAVSGDPEEMRDWLKRRETARFLLERGRFGLAANRDQYLDVAESFLQLANNRYRLADPAYNIQAAYWAGRAYEAADEWAKAAELFSRVGGVNLPDGMEGDAAQRLSRCLRRQAEEIPYPGDSLDRQQRARLLGQAIGELDRARLAFPVGPRRKEIELDRIALRMAGREAQFVREAATEAEAFIESDPSKDDLRARAVLYRGQAAAIMGDPETAAKWFRRVIAEETPSDEDARQARLELGLALLEMADSGESGERRRLFGQAAETLEMALSGAPNNTQWNGARVIRARILLNLDQPSAALETLAPALAGPPVNYQAWLTAGKAELQRGRLAEAMRYLYPPTRPSNPDPALRAAASQDGAKTAEARRDYGFALALNHQASRVLRRNLLFSALLSSEFQAADIFLKMGRLDGPLSLSGDLDALMSTSDAAVVDAEKKRTEETTALAQSLGILLAGGGNPDSAYDLAIRAEAADEWLKTGLNKLELSIAMLGHLRVRRPEGIADSVLSTRLGQARHALALARAEAILAGAEPSENDIEQTLRDFADAAANFQESSTEGFSRQDSLDQGMVNLESGVFLLRLAERWNRGRWSSPSLSWREEARRRIEASLRPFNQAIAASPPASLASRRARWSRGRALEQLGEWRGAAADYLSLMNNSELPRTLRVNAARRWAGCMKELGETRQALSRLSVFADIDAEAALLDGKLAAAAGYPREAYQRYLFAANPSAPALPPATPGRVQEAAYLAAKLAMANPTETNPLQPPAATLAAARDMLEKNAFAAPGSPWAIPMLNLLGDDWIRDEPDGWRQALRLATRAMEAAGPRSPLERAMHLLAAQALEKGGEYAEALNELDAARELAGDGQAGRADAARVTLETARVYRAQKRDGDALRAYADVFASYPEEGESAEAARREAALMLLSRPDAGAKEKEQARSILNGLRDQMLAEKILRDHGMR